MTIYPKTTVMQPLGERLVRVYIEGADSEEFLAWESTYGKTWFSVVEKNGWATYFPNVRVVRVEEQLSPVED